MTDAPVPNPEVGGGLAPSVTTAQPVAETPQSSPPSAAPAPQHPAEIPSLIETLVAPGADILAPSPEPETVAAPADAPKDPAEPSKEAAAEAPKPADAAPAPEPTPPQVQAPVVIDPTTLKLPEGFTAKPEQLGEFATLLSDAALPPTDRAQKLLDMHTSALKSYAEEVNKQSLDKQISVFNNYRADMRKQVMSDPQLGGSGHQTAMGVVARMRDMFASLAPRGSEQHTRETKEFIDMLRLTGAGDHPAMLRYMHNNGRIFDEASPPPPNPRPPPDIGKNPNKPGGLRALYKSPANGAAR